MFEKDFSGVSHTVFHDDRTPEQKKYFTWLVIGTDKFLSEWGGSKGGKSIAAWACRPEDRDIVFAWVSSRSDMLRVREVSEAIGRKYHPSGRGIAHVHIYVVDKDHPVLYLYSQRRKH